MSEISTEKISTGVNFNFISDNRFKTNRISAALFLPLSKDTASANALAASLITRSCKKYPDFTSLSKRLSQLYGASLYSYVRKFGEVQALVITAAGIDDKYAIDDMKISKELTDLLCMSMFEPNIENGAFIEGELEQERRQLVESIDAEFNDKRTFAVKRCIEIMCENEAFSTSRTGTKENVQLLSGKQVYNAWTEALQKAKIELYMLGDTKADFALESFKNAFSSKGREIELKTEIVPKAKNVKRITERQDVTQSKLVLGFRTPVAEPNGNTAALKLMTAVLGGTPSSKLFTNVREKMSLCYYCASRYDPNKGIILVDSGVENENTEKTEKAILEQLKAMQAGDITDEEISAAKLAMRNSYMTYLDSLSMIENFYLSQTFNGRVLTPKQAAEQIFAVTKDQIVEAANAVSLDTVYVLTGKEE